MTTRRGGRPTHVRPRPPSNGRPAPAGVRPRPPAPGRLSSHRRIDRGTRLPFAVRLLLVSSVLALTVGVIYVGMGGLPRVVGAVGSGMAGLVDDVMAGLTATPSPSATTVPVSTSPLIEAPDEPYTSEASVDLVVTVPSALAGDERHRVRIYLALKDQAPSPIGEVPVGQTPRVVVPVELTKGINDFSVTIVGPGGESEPSPVVRYVLDQSPPKITISSPKSGAKINRSAVTVTGKTQARTTLIARNRANDASISVVAGTDGTFEFSLPIAAGSNEILVTGTDPAGNVGEGKVTVRRGSGRLTVDLSANQYQIKRSSLPETARLVATVTDPDGRPLAGAAVTFTLSIPGIATVTRDGTTDGNGRASFETTIPKSASVGQGLGAVLVTTTEFGEVDDRTVITILK